jgi:hypothetical protein
MWTTINKDAAVAAAPRGESLELKEHRLRLRYDEARASGDAAAFASLLQELGACAPAAAACARRRGAGWTRRKDEAACLPALRLLALRAYGDVLDKSGDAKGALEADAHALELAPDDVGLWLSVAPSGALGERRPPGPRRGGRLERRGARRGQRRFWRCRRVLRLASVECGDAAARRRRARLAIEANECVIVTQPSRGLSATETQSTGAAPAARRCTRRRERHA